MTPRRPHGRPCPSCGGHCPAGTYVCSGCWQQLAPAARTALFKRDARAIVRHQELLDQLGDTPLHRIEISP